MGDERDAGAGGQAVSKAIRVPQDATLEEAAAICADRFLLFAPKTWSELHDKVRRAGYILVPGARKARTVDTKAIRARAERALTDVEALCDALDAERARAAEIQAAFDAYHAEALAHAAKLQAVVDALPRCDAPGCRRTATRGVQVHYRCDEHMVALLRRMKDDFEEKDHVLPDLPYAAALRALGEVDR